MLGTTAALDLRPERQTEIEGGIDATLFTDRATVELTYYNKTIKDVILTRTLAPSSGFARSIFNGGEINTRGVEAGLTLVPVFTRDFQWTMRSTFGLDRSTVEALPVPRFTIQGFGYFYGSTVAEAGESITQLWGNGPIRTAASWSKSGLGADGAFSYGRNPTARRTVDGLTCPSWHEVFTADPSRGPNGAKRILHLSRHLLRGGVRRVCLFRVIR